MRSIKAALDHGGTKRPKRDRKEARRKHVQIATVDPATGRPAVRTIAFRGFLTLPSACSGNESCMLTFVTDSRAQKVKHLSSPGSFVECCWWMDEANVQFRIAGHAVLATPNCEDLELRLICESVWQRLKGSTQRTFTWPSPGMPKSSSSSDVPSEALQKKRN